MTLQFGLVTQECCISSAGGFMLQQGIVNVLELP